MKNQRSTHGGARKGAGRPALYGAPLERSLAVGLAGKHLRAITTWRRKHPECKSDAAAVREMIESVAGLAPARSAG